MLAELPDLRERSSALLRTLPAHASLKRNGSARGDRRPSRAAYRARPSGSDGGARQREIRGRCCGTAARPARRVVTSTQRPRAEVAHRPTAERPFRPGEKIEIVVAVDMTDTHSRWNPFQITPQFVERDVGGTFLDLLFGFVVADIFQQAVSSGFSGARTAQLILAGVVTITSWLGYHQSRGRTPFRLEYFNLPMLQFTVHLGLIVVFFRLAERSEPIGPTRSATAVPESILVVVTFALYTTWETSSKVVWRTRRYLDALPRTPKWDALRADPEVHITPTAVFTVVAVAFTAAIWIFDPRGSSTVVAVDCIWLVFVVGHRYLQGVANRWPA